ncbi:MAG: L,D-transpeptidase [Gammaproteobacteria bacterium]|nr:L,D-transpeptidase [Gammaproteobacteria bacterium]
MVAEQNKYIEISLSSQNLVLRLGDEVLFQSRISSALNGAGEQSGSECTPRGLHYISEMVGDHCDEGAVFIGRNPTGEIYSDDLGEKFPGRDWILTRILRLSGKEVGYNKGGNVDTHDRLIYIHGTPEESAIGKPVSHGCIRMKNQDIIKLFDLIEDNTDVMIRD